MIMGGTFKLSVLTIILYAAYVTTLPNPSIVEIGSARQNAKLSANGYSLSASFETQVHKEQQYDENFALVQGNIEIPDDVIEKRFLTIMGTLNEYMTKALGKSIDQVDVHCVTGPEEKICKDGTKAPSGPLNPDIRVSHGEGGYPYVAGPGGCGDPGAYIHLPYTFFLTELNKQGEPLAKDDKPLYGDLRKSMLWLWVTYRYGVPPDHGCYGHPWFPEVIETRHEKDRDSTFFTWNGCVDDNPFKDVDFIPTKFCQPKLSSASHDVGTGLELCKMRDSDDENGFLSKTKSAKPNRHINMYWSEEILDSQEFLCDAETHRHAYRTPLSLLCPLKGQRDVIQQHPDFKDDVSLVLQERQTPSLKMELFSHSGNLPLQQSNIYVSVFPGNPATKMYAVLTYRLMYTRSMVILGSMVEATVVGKTLELRDDGAAPDSYPEDGYYSGLLPINGKQSGSVKVVIKVIPAAKQSVSVMPCHMTRPGLIPIRNYAAIERYTMCDVDTVKLNDVKGDVFGNKEGPIIRVSDGICIFFSNKNKNLCQYEYGDIPECNTWKSQNDWSERNFHLEHKWCKKIHPDARMIVIRDKVELNRLNAFYKASFEGEKEVYWIGGERRTFCPQYDSDLTACTKPEIIQVKKGTKTLSYKTQFRWAAPSPNEQEDPFEFNDHDAKVWSSSEQPNNSPVEPVGCQNWLTIGTVAAGLFNDWHWKSEEMKMGCGLKGSHNLFFVSRTFYACNIASVASHCPLTNRPKEVSVAQGQNESRTFACKDLKNKYEEKIEFSLNPGTTDFSSQSKPLPPKSADFKVEVDKKGNGTLSFLNPSTDPGTYKYEFCCGKDIKVLSSTPKCSPIDLKDMSKVNPTSISGDNAFSCYVRAKDPQTNENSDPSNVVSGYVSGICLTPQYDRMKERKVRLELEGTDEPITVGRSVTMSCASVTGFLYDGTAPLKGCEKTLKAVCKEGEKLMDKFPADPWCKKKAMNDDCTEHCECEDSIPTVGSGAKEKGVECSNDKKCMNKADYLPAKGGTMVVKNDCGNPPSLAGGHLKDPKEFKNGDNATMECNNNMYIDGDRDANIQDVTTICIFDEKTGTFSWNPSKLSFCERGLFDSPCNVSSDPSDCPAHSYCSDKASKCACHDGFVEHKKKCIFPNCLLGKGKPNGAYKFPNEQIMIGDTVTFVCNPNHFISASKKEGDAGGYVRQIEGLCKLINEHDTFPKIVPPIQLNHCERKLIGDQCDQKTPCELSYQGQSVVCKDGKCTCSGDVDYDSNLEICQGPKELTKCEEPQLQSDSGVDVEPNNDGGFTLKCPGDQHFVGEEERGDITLVCQYNHWIATPPLHENDIQGLKCQPIGYGSACDPAETESCPGEHMRCDPITRSCVCEPKHKFNGKVCDPVTGECEKFDLASLTSKIKDSNGNEITPSDFPTPGDPQMGYGAGFTYACPDGEVFSNSGFESLSFICLHQTDENGHDILVWKHNPKHTSNEQCVKKPTQVGESCSAFADDVKESVCAENIPFSVCEKSGNDETCKCLPDVTNSTDDGKCQVVKCLSLQGFNVDVIKNASLADAGYEYGVGLVADISCDLGQAVEGTPHRMFAHVRCEKDGKYSPHFQSVVIKNDSEILPCVKSPYCGESDKICNETTSFCDPKTSNCKCKDGYKRYIKNGDCISKFCPKVEDVKRSCVRGNVYGTGEVSHDLACRCKPGYRMPNGKSKDILNCLFDLYPAPNKENPQWQNSSALRPDDPIKFLPCERYEPEKTKLDICREVYREKIGHDVDEDGYPHRYSSLAFLTLGWSTGMTLVSVAAWAGVAYVIYSRGLL